MTAFHTTMPSNCVPSGGCRASRSDISVISNGQEIASAASRGLSPASWISATYGAECTYRSVQLSVSDWKPCAKPSGSSESQPVFGRQLFGVPLQKSRRPFSNIKRDIQNCAAQARNKLSLRVRRMLKMHTPDRATLCRDGMIDLRDRL